MSIAAKHHHVREKPTSKRISQRECGIAAVKVLQLDGRKSKRIRVSRLIEPVIIPSHLVGESSSDIDRNRRVWPLIVEIESAGRRERVEEDRVAAHKAAAITRHRGHSLH